MKMPNMSYCRFENTLADLLDCQAALLDDDLSDDEKKARRRLIRVCREIADEAADMVESETSPG